MLRDLLYVYLNGIILVNFSDRVHFNLSIPLYIVYDNFIVNLARKIYFDVLFIYLSFDGVAIL